VDLHFLDTAFVGANEIFWDGADNQGVPVPPGTYNCQIKLTVGEFHYVADDIETSFEGFRLFSLDAALSRTGLDMYWNDAEIQFKATTMPNLEISLENPGPFGLYSGLYADAADANVNARAWGAFILSTKGNESYLDTYTWIDDDESIELPITVIDPTLDTDGEGLLGSRSSACWFSAVGGADYSATIT
jgi:hypothetical protein